MREYSNEEKKLLAQVLPDIAQELRSEMTNMHISMGRLAPVEARERDEATDHNAAVFAQSYYRMNRVINNLTSAADLAEDGLFRLTANVDIVGLVRDLCKQSEALFADKGVALVFESNRAGQVIAMDTERITRLLFNLLSNALKYTGKDGTVTVSVSVSARHVLLSVRDTGCGIAPDRLDRVFDSFLDGDPMRTPPRGVGLGLALCRRIAEGHGGSIVAESTPGKGSRFTVSLPNRQSGTLTLREPGTTYTGGFNSVLLELSDGLGVDAFSCRHLD